MAKRKAKKPAKPDWSGPDRSSLLDNAFARVCEGVVDDAGNIDINQQLEYQSARIGLPLPSLALQYLFQLNVLPLPRVVQLIGAPMSCKSSFLYEILRWHAVSGGYGMLIENEGKDAPELYASVLGYDPAVLRRFTTSFSQSVEDWQSILTFYLNRVRELMDAIDGPGRTVPVAVGIDSLAGSTDRHTIDAIRKDGHAKRGFPVLARLITEYARANANVMRGYPCTVVATNHLKEATTPMGIPTIVTPGGVAFDFAASYTVQMKRKKHTQLVDRETMTIEFKMIKNSLGPVGRVIEADFVWWHELEGEQLRARHAWDWDAATIDLLSSIEKRRNATTARQVAAIVDLRLNRLKRVSSDALGIPDSNPVSMSEAGAMIRHNAEMVAELQNVLEIRRIKVFREGVPFQSQMEESLEDSLATYAQQSDDMLPEEG